VSSALHSCLRLLLGTAVSSNAPLMSVGLDSIAASEFTSAVSSELGVSVSAIMLFDHPTLDSIADYVMSEARAEAGSEDASQVEQAAPVGLV